MRDLHTALKSQVLGTAQGDGTQFQLVELRHGRDDVNYSLHAYPNTWSTAGIQRTDTLAYLSFRRSDCTFFPARQCYVKEVGEAFPLDDFATAFSTAHAHLVSADNQLRECGLPLDIKEGWGFFHGRPSQSRVRDRGTPGDGHRGSEARVLKRANDDVFQYVLTWLESPYGKGWVTHIRPKHPPLTSDVRRALQMLNLQSFHECPEFDFDGCSWFYRSGGTDFHGSFLLASDAHAAFERLPQHFSFGLRELVEANAPVEPLGFPLLPQAASIFQPDRVPLSGAAPMRPSAHRPGTARLIKPTAKPLPESFDVALSFSGVDRAIAEAIATAVRDAGFSVFYDDFYPEHLWGQDLPACLLPSGLC